MRKLLTSTVLLFALTALVVPQQLGGSGKIGGTGVVRRAAAGGGATAVYDTFTNVDAAFSSHTGETGASWTLIGGGFAGWIISNRYTGAAETIRVYPSGTPASADYDIEAAFYVASNETNARTEVRGRWDTGADDYYSCGYLQTDGKWHIQKITGGGAPAEIGTPYTQALTVSNTYVMRCRIQGTTLKLDVDGVERVSGTDSSFSATGTTGVHFNSTQASTTGYHVDYFWVGPNGGTVGP